jgi:hypothetical protein
VSKKPVLVLFDEVPGCSTVLGFGRGALRDPLLVEAIETLFEPVLVYNNTPADASLLKSFGEPAWNNPVVRVLAPDRSDLAPRFAGPYAAGSFAAWLVEAHPDPPRWLRDHAADLEGTARAKTATYSMACFWSGEAHLSSAPGVLAARTGWQGGQEVVEVTYDPTVLSTGDLDAHAASARYSKARAGSLRATPSDDHHALQRTHYARAALTPGQATRVNSRLAKSLSPDDLLSPRQLAAVRR